jgi:hypothetical protein
VKYSSNNTMFRIPVPQQGTRVVIPDSSAGKNAFFTSRKKTNQSRTRIERSASQIRTLPLCLGTSVCSNPNYGILQQCKKTKIMYICQDLSQKENHQENFARQQSPEAKKFG